MSNQFKELDLVWAKLHGYPWWPAYIRSLNTQNQYEVVFLSDFSLSYLPGSKIRKYAKLVGKKEGDSKAMRLSIQRANSILEGRSTIIEEYYKEKSKNLNKISGKKENCNDMGAETTSTVPRRKRVFNDYSQKMNRKSSTPNTIKKSNKVKLLIQAAQKPELQVNDLENDPIELKLRLLEQRLESLVSCMQVELELESAINELCDITAQVIDTPVHYTHRSRILSLLTQCQLNCKNQLKRGKTIYMEIHEVIKALIDQINYHFVQNGLNGDFNIKPAKGAHSNSNKIDLNREVMFGLPNNNIPKMASKDKKVMKELNHIEKETNVSIHSVEIDPVLVRRVRVKIAKTIFIQARFQQIEKQQCKIVACRIEGILQSTSHSEVEYKERAVDLVRNLEKSRGKARVDILRCITEEEDYILAHNVYKLMSN